MRVITRYHIYKKTHGVPYPGEHWETCPSLREAKNRLATAYEDDRRVFRIVKTTEEALTR